MNTWVLCEVDGTVEAGHCTCMAGLGEVCSHVAAILFYLESASHVTTTCTQTDCTWKQPRLVETIPYARIMDIPFTKPKGTLSSNRKRGAHLYSDTVPLSDLPKPLETQNFSVVELASESDSNGMGTELPFSEIGQESSQHNALQSPNEQFSAEFSFLQLLQVPCTDADKLEFLTENESFDPAINSIMPPLSEKFKTSSPAINLPPSLRDLYRPENEELTYLELIAVCEQVSLTISDEQTRIIEAATREQSKTTAWFTQRAGRITASVMKQVCATDPGNPSQSLIHRICYPELNKFFSKATKWGCDHEDLAKSAYVDNMKDVHTGFVCKDSGLVVSSTHPFIGASPDGSIQCECCTGIGVLEVKCPYCVRDGEPSSAPYIQDDGTLTRTHTYYYQVQTQLLVCSADYADFVVATFCGGNVNISTQRICQDEGFIKDIVDKSTYFFELCLLPELVAKWYSRVQVMPAQTAAASTSTDMYIYCHCKDDKGGDMVGCDNKECEHGQWFHLECLKMKNPPRTNKWYCPDCRKLPQFTRKKQRK